MRDSESFIIGGFHTMAQNGGGQGWLTDEEPGEKIMPKKFSDKIKQERINFLRKLAKTKKYTFTKKYGD